MFKITKNSLILKNIQLPSNLARFSSPISTRFFSTKPNEEKADDNKEKQDEEDLKGSKFSDYKFSRKIRILLGKLIKYSFYTYGALLIYNYYLYKGNHTASIKQLQNDHFKNVIENIRFFYRGLTRSLTEPYSSSLLPDNVDQILEKKKTLILNLNKTIINYEYKMGTGFEIMKRPGVVKFLQELSQYYEIVIFGVEDQNFVEQISNSLDPFKLNIFYSLGKEATRLSNGKYVKDLRLMNRNLENIVILDYDPENVKFNTENLIVVPEFKGDTNDRELVHMIHFLIALSKPTVKDVRKEIQKYGNLKPHIKFYKSDKKYHKLVPSEYSKDISEDLGKK